MILCIKYIWRKVRTNCDKHYYRNLTELYPTPHHTQKKTHPKTKHSESITKNICSLPTPLFWKQSSFYMLNRSRKSSAKYFFLKRNPIIHIKWVIIIAYIKWQHIDHVYSISNDNKLTTVIIVTILVNKLICTCTLLINVWYHSELSQAKKTKESIILINVFQHKNIQSYSNTIIITCNIKLYRVY